MPLEPRAPRETEVDEARARHSQALQTGAPVQRQDLQSGAGNLQHLLLRARAPRELQAARGGPRLGGAVVRRVWRQSLGHRVRGRVAGGGGRGRGVGLGEGHAEVEDAEDGEGREGAVDPGARQGRARGGVEAL